MSNRTAPIPLDDGDLGASLMRRVVITIDGCWIWQGKKDRHGYGRLTLPVSHRDIYVHRAAYSWFKAPIPSGLVIDHLCRVRACCNPEHLEPVTSAENTRRGKPLHQTHCKRGHEFTPENTYMRGAGRICRECSRSRVREWKAANRRPRPTRAPDATDGRAKLTELQVAEIRRRFTEGGISQRALAREFGVSFGLIHLIVRNRIWQNVQ